jgi:hypothetical protein
MDNSGEKSLAFTAEKRTIRSRNQKIIYILVNKLDHQHT